MQQTRTILEGFVALEGIDGAGTTTQLRRLSARLEAAGVAFSTECEPTPGPVGRLIRQALSGAFDARPETVARLFAADRGEHLYGPGGILERTAAGSLVVSDRYLFSSLAYQGLTCGPDLPAELNAPFPLPELLLFFELDPEIAAERMAARDSLEIYENLAFQRRVDAAYRAVVSSFEGSGMAVVRVDAAASPDEVERTLWSAIEPISM
ncbi:MAG TPA: dTMP kinase, partial [Spirochaetales bacterium]|nr:dTMP kinase [Spirochaetales bacterium]